MIFIGTVKNASTAQLSAHCICTAYSNCISTTTAQHRHGLIELLQESLPTDTTALLT
jgi:hypothetical protein